MSVKDYYRILGVPRNASEIEIKNAFRKLAKEHHPDKGGSKAKFQEVNEAYKVLSDPEQKAEYDNPTPRPQVSRTRIYEYEEEIPVASNDHLSIFERGYEKMEVEELIGHLLDDELPNPQQPSKKVKPPRAKTVDGKTLKEQLEECCKGDPEFAKAVKEILG